MKMKYYFTLLWVVLLTAACGGGDSAPAVSLSQDSFKEVGYDNTTLEVDIKTALNWTATSLVRWCSVSQSSGEGDVKLKLTLDANLDGAMRTGVVKIWTEEKIVDITIQQQALPAGQEYHYKLPVIFHVLYKDKADKLQYVSHTRLAEVLENVNDYYKGNSLYNGGEATVDMNLEFVLAETDEDGNKLSTPGVEYIAVNEMPMNCSVFMSAQKYVDMLWDPNKYINVMLYNFSTVDGGSSIILGVSHLPFTTAGAHELQGVNVTPHEYLTKENLGFPKCVSINSLYINEETGSDGKYNSFDVNVTMAHELGHYLGLLHAFDEDDNSADGLSSECVNSDYCEDTPSYNRIAYMYDLKVLLSEAREEGRSVNLSEGALRENCKTGQTFYSYNLMDYEMSYADRFTNDQRARIRHVLSYSPLTPGPKKGRSASTRAPEGVLDVEPMMVVCQH